MATGFLQRAGVGRHSATARVQSVRGQSSGNKQPKALSAWQWVMEQQSSGPWGSHVLPPPWPPA